MVLRAGDVLQCGAVLLVLRAAPASAHASDAGSPSLVVARDAGWFHVDGGERTTLGRRGALRRILLALARRRIEEPGRATPLPELFEIGWPGDRARFESAQARVYTSVQRLRALGVGALLMTRDDGYLLDPASLVAWDGAQAGL